MPDPIVLAKAVLLAAVVTAAAAWLAERLARRFGDTTGRAGAAAGVGLGILAGAWALGLAPPLPPRDAIGRLLAVLIPAAVLAESAAALRSGWLVRFAVAAGAVPVLVYGSSYVADLSGPGSREWSPGLAWLLFAGLATALFLVWTALVRLAERANRSASLAVAGTSVGAGLTIMLSGYAAGGQLGLPLAAAAGVLSLVGGRRSPAGVGVATVGLFGLLVVGRLFAGLSTENAALLFGAPLLAWLPELPPLRGWGPRTRGGLRLALAAVPVVVAIAFAQRKFAADSAGAAQTPGESSVNDYLGYGQ